MSAIKSDFIRRLDILKDSKKDVIDGITKICSMNAKHAKILTEALFDVFKKAKIDRKVSLLNLMDSILKNCKEHYQAYLEEGIIDAFCDAYEASTGIPEIRRRLRILFKTWEPYFSGNTIMSIIMNIQYKLRENINESFTIEELDNLIQYYQKNGIDPTSLELQKKFMLDQGKREEPKVKKVIEKKRKEEPSGSMMAGPDADSRLARQPEKKSLKPSSGKPLGASKQPTMVPELERESSQKYQIPKKTKPGMGREKPGIEKDEQSHAPISKFSKLEPRPGMIHRQEESQNPNFVDMQGGRPGGMNQMGMQKPYAMQGGPNRDRYSYQQQHGFDEQTEAQFSDDETKNANYGQGMKPKSHYQPQFSHMQNKYPHQMQQQPQMRDQHLAMQHQQVHPNYQQPPQLLHPSGFHPGPGQSPMAGNQYPGRQQMQQMPMNYQQMGSNPNMLSHQQYPHDQRVYQATSPRNRQQQFIGSDNVAQQQPFINKQQMAGVNQPHEREKLMEMKEMFQSSLKQQPKEFEPIPNVPTRNDSFPEPTTLSARKSSEVYDQSGVLVFKTLLSHMKQELPSSIKSKYQQRLGNQESLSSMMNRRNLEIAQTLYEQIPYRCSSCGMRFTNKALLYKHLDWHYQFNMDLKDKSKDTNLGRIQLITIDHWIKDEGNKNYKTSNIENAEEDFEFENYVPSSENTKSCKACGEVFKETWDGDKEMWLLENAAKIKYEEEDGGTAADGTKQKSVNFDLMHFRCYKLCLQNESK